MLPKSIYLSASVGLLINTVVGDVFDTKKYAKKDIITRDVAVIGGGASGTYAAINLRMKGTSVVVVEKEDVFGGHTNTYTDPATGTTVDYGVQAYLNSTITLDFFAHFNVSVVDYSPSSVTIEPADFKTGETVIFNPGEDLTPWAQQLAKYPWIDYTWDVPQPVPADLLLPFGEFIIKYNLTDLAYYIYFSASGLSNPLEQLTINVMKMVDQAYIDESKGAGLGTANQDNSEIYVKAVAELGSSALLSSTVTAASRSTSGVSLVVKTPSGSKLIKAKKLLITIPPTMENMGPFALNTQERNLFSQFTYMGYYTILLNNTGLPSGYEWINANDSLSTYNIPELPGACQIMPTRISGLFYAWYRSPVDVTQQEVEASTIAAIQKLQKAGNYTATNPTVVEYRSHTPFKLKVTAEAISNGFYDELYGLQGKRNTWYTGAAMVSHNTGVIWDFTNTLLLDLVDNLG
ncbi:hypothetical protein N7495_005118 [Penicillium taxi]|uniref:uncharacterized protein n=1 Tax=Penicillium taxi TaxID=168475 RepID=UPI0025453052|nr:uncharacterized protein N7495_005118 [Penicillium taxi]KAJ5893427.1 hypothetical protein N7495_005118 [Penicillium taxi]